MSPEKPKPQVFFIVGPTAVGKSQLAVDLALSINGEVISADSRYLYRGMDIGTAKPTCVEMRGIRHHLIDVAEPDENWTLAEYLAQIEVKIQEVINRGKTPVIIGGTGQYFRAMVEGWSPPIIEPSKTYREVLQRWSEVIGFDELHKKLGILDPNAASLIDPKNGRRSIRALEVIFTTGKKFSELRMKTGPKYDFWVIGLHLERQELYKRIDERIEQMFSNGFVDEVKRLKESGYNDNLPSMSAIGYQEVFNFINGEASMDQVKNLMKQKTRNLVRRQSNWFKITDPLIHWYESQSAPLDKILHDLPKEILQSVRPEYQKPWLKSYDPGVPTTLDYPETCIHDSLIKNAERIPSRIAIIYGNQQLSYLELYRVARRFAGGLVARGVKPGDRVGILLPNSIEFAISFFGTLMAGGIISAMNPSFPASEIIEQVTRTKPKAIIGSEIALEALRGYFGSKEIFFFVEVREKRSQDESEANYSPRDGRLSFDLMVSEPNEDVTLPNVKSSEQAVFQFTGGTTGTPKVAIGTHKNIVSNVLQFKSWLVTLQEDKETFLVAIPLYHVYGMVLGLNLGVAMGATMVFSPDPKNMVEILDSIVTHNVTYFPGVPAMFSMINLQADVLEKKVNLKGIKACISGASPLPERVRRQFEKLTGGSLVEGYGLSEAPTATHCNPILGGKRAGSIGLPLPDVECRIISPDDQDVAQGCEGELLIKGPQVMAGYLENSTETALTLKNGWLHTGDIAYMDEDGYFYIKGRIKELIKVNGLQVWPTEVERVVGLLSGVKECAVAGILDESGTEKVKVWIVPFAEETFTLQEIQSFCADKLVSYKIPTELMICKGIPKTSVGKVLRRNLERL